MKIKRTKLLALVLALAVFLSGCGIREVAGELSQILGSSDLVPFDSMEYQHPDLAAIRASLDTAISVAEDPNSTTDAVVDAIYGFYDEYDWFYTCSALADIHYSIDLTDIYWEKEYSYCQDQTGAVDAMLEELYYALAASPHRAVLEAEHFGEGYFESYDGDNMWDAVFVSLLEAESILESRYYELSSQALDHVPGSEEYYDAVAEDMAILLVELIALRQEIADYWGYTNYVDFANDFYYYRDFTASDMADYLSRIRDLLVPVYLQIREEDWDAAYRTSSETETFRYVRTAAKNMGGLVEEAFNTLEQGGLYDIGYSENKYTTSFEIYLTSYWEPFIFMNPTLSRYDWLTFAHEFGHFCNDYASYGSYAGTDVLEVFSQGMEYLTLPYGEKEEELTRLKMADSLSVYVEQSVYAAFEQQMYDLTGDDLTTANLYDLYDRIVREYSFDTAGYDPREFVTIPHFYTNPMYVISYVVSNDAALQLYQLEKETPGAGLQCFEENLDTQESYFLAFLETAGLESPFAEGRLEQVKATFESFFGE